MKIPERGLELLKGAVLKCIFAGIVPFASLGATLSEEAQEESLASSPVITLFLCGDVMTGRGIDQVLPHPGDPRIQESYMKSARGYVELAERRNGPIPKPVSFSYIWGDALEELQRIGPDVRVINLETSVTTSDAYLRGKGIHYRMHPENVGCLTAAGVDVCSLANNHVLDWGDSGLEETLASLSKVKIRVAGAGRHLADAEAPAVVGVEGKGRVIVFGFGFETSGIPRRWAASRDRLGVNLITDMSPYTVREIRSRVYAMKKPGDIVVASIHWGGNWGYHIPERQREFAHNLIDTAGFDIIHGHSSHHVKAMEVYRNRPILYGCGDFLNDYEGIRRHEEFRADLTLMYFAGMDAATGSLVRLEMIPLKIRNFRLQRTSRKETRWLREVLNREGQWFGTRAELNPDNSLTLA